MPFRRKEPPRVAVFDRCMAIHLACGDCFLAGPPGACYCGLIDANGELNEALAKRMWQEHKAEILAEWKEPGLPWALEKFGE